MLHEWHAFCFCPPMSTHADQDGHVVVPHLCVIAYPSPDKEKAPSKMSHVIVLHVCPPITMCLDMYKLSAYGADGWCRVAPLGDTTAMSNQ